MIPFLLIFLWVLGYYKKGFQCEHCRVLFTITFSLEKLDLFHCMEVLFPEYVHSTELHFHTTGEVQFLERLSMAQIHGLRIYSLFRNASSDFIV